jgi:hypothetical protein
VCLDPGKSGAKLSLNDEVGLSRITILECFSHAQNRLKAMPEGGQNFFIRPAVLVAEILSPLRMADEDKLATDVLQHGPGHFAGECSFIFPIEILRAEEKGRGRAQRLAYGVQRRKWRCQADLDSGMVGQFLR